MSKNNIASKLDKIAITSALFMFFLIIFSRVFDNIIYNVIVSVLIIIALHMFWHAITKSKRQRTMLKKAETAKMNLIAQNLTFYCNNNLNDIFTKLFKASGYEYFINDNFLNVTKNDVSYIVIYAFDEKPIDAKVVHNAERTKNLYNADAFLLLCNSFSIEAKSTLEYVNNPNSKIFCKNSIFLQMKKHDTFIETPYQKIKTKNTFSEVLAYAFNRSRFKNYFFLGFIMYLFSYITPLKTYYLAFSALLFTLSLICMVNKKYNKTKPISYEEF